ncbi:MAG: hypothetical protein FVQ84_22800 [Planctomycetes bacterium]|nr:hypothetical protein [Planctomycetota bacterium]
MNKMEIENLKKKYPEHNIICEPQKECQACEGTGEHLNGMKEKTLCICTCVELEDIGKLFMGHISTEMQKMRNKNA